MKLVTFSIPYQELINRLGTACFAQKNCCRIFIYNFAKLPHDAMHFGQVHVVLMKHIWIPDPVEPLTNRIVRHLRIFKKCIWHIKTKPCSATVQPEPHDLAERILHFWISPVEIWLPCVKKVIVVLTRQ